MAMAWLLLELWLWGLAVPPLLHLVLEAWGHQVLLQLALQQVSSSVPGSKVQQQGISSLGYPSDVLVTGCVFPQACGQPSNQ